MKIAALQMVSTGVLADNLAQAGALLNEWLHPLFAPLLAQRFGAPVLPDDGMVDGYAGLAAPDDGGFSLVCDTNRPDLSGGDSSFGQGVARSGELNAPDLLCVVLHPARLREYLR